MNKKRILTTLAVSVGVLAGVSLLGAFEAHVVNVKAHIENALYVQPEELDFGVVFPQEYLEKAIKVELSGSFEEQDRVHDVEYKIVQKPKPKWEVQGIDWSGKATTVEEARKYCIDHPEDYEYCYRSLCSYLSKMKVEDDQDNDTDVLSYYVDGASPSCQTPSPDYATGHLDKDADVPDTEDHWAIDLKVPPIDGYVGQDWPQSCIDLGYVLDEDSQDYGCDLWIEVTGFSYNYTSLVNVGNTTSEEGYVMQGWSDEVWPQGGGWGGGDDGTIRTVAAVNDDYKSGYLDEDSAIVDMDFGSGGNKLYIRHLDGLANDSFEVFVDGASVGIYADAYAVETWLNSSFNTTGYSGVHAVRIKLTGAHWGGYGTWGQLGISKMGVGPSQPW